ncbi:serine/threonine-protein kinase, partial [Rhodopirellula sallentina]
MKLSDLPARELARLDAICLEYESQARETLRRGGDVKSLEEEIRPLVERYGGEHAPLLRAELQAILEELVRGEGDPAPQHPAVASSGAASTPSDRNPSSTNPTSTNPTPGNPTPASGQSVQTPAPQTPSAETASPQNQSTHSQTPQPTPADAHGAATEGFLHQSSDANADSSGDSPAPLPRLGDTIGPYVLTSILGRGGMGIVYRATDTRLDRSVAIKMLSLHDRQSHVLVERFQREAKAVAALTHPHIVELFDIGVFKGMPFVVMEHLRGETLLQRMQRDRIESEPITTQQVRNWGIQLADALAVAHSSGVIHRDIKPENVMVMRRTHPSSTTGSAKSSDSQTGSNESSLKLFDFGLSRVGSTNWQKDSGLTRALTPENINKISDTDSATRVGMILGTPGYMAPEQARGGVITPAADVFSLGCVLFEAMFGRPAFSGETATKRFSAVLEKQALADPARRRDDVALSDLILSMLSKDPAARPSAADVLETLKATTPDSQISRRSVSTITGSTANVDDGAVVISRRRLVEMIGGAVAGGLLGATVLPSRASGEMRAIRSIGVLRFQSASETADAKGDTPPPDRRL